MKCPNCGEWNYHQSKQCVKCGSTLKKSKRNSSKTTQAETTPQESSKGFWEENGHLIAHAAIKLLFG